MVYINNIISICSIWLLYLSNDWLPQYPIIKYY